jgi:hypothetical protein
MWTVFERPRDFPNSFVARRFVIRTNGTIEAEPKALIASDLEGIRDLIRAIDPNLFCLPRNENDEPQIVETWF